MAIPSEIVTFLATKHFIWWRDSSNGSNRWTCKFQNTINHFFSVPCYHQLTLCCAYFVGWKDSCYVQKESYSKCSAKTTTGEMACSHNVYRFPSIRPISANHPSIQDDDQWWNCHYKFWHNWRWHLSISCQIRRHHWWDLKDPLPYW